MKKWLYAWHDWGIYAVDEVEVLEEGLIEPKHPNSKFAIVILEKGTIFRRLKVDMKNIFDTKEEADEYGRENCPTCAFRGGRV